MNDYKIRVLFFYVALHKNKNLKEGKINRKEFRRSKKDSSRLWEAGIYCKTDRSMVICQEGNIY